MKNSESVKTDQIQLIKETLFKNGTDEELKLFIYTAQRLGLDPLARQIYPVKRYDINLRKETMQIQTGIDGYRLIADRTGFYSPGRDVEYSYNDHKQLVSAKAFVMKQTPDGSWHEVSASAFYDEYVAKKKDGTPNNMWRTKQHIMLGKCAEALALRKAFPAELSGVYTKEEMEQAENPQEENNNKRKITDAEHELLEMYLEHDIELKTNMLKHLSTMGITSLVDLTADVYPNYLKRAKQGYQEKHQEIEHQEALEA